MLVSSYQIDSVIEINDVYLLGLVGFGVVLIGVFLVVVDGVLDEDFAVVECVDDVGATVVVVFVDNIGSMVDGCFDVVGVMVVVECVVDDVVLGATVVCLAVAVNTRQF